MDEALHNMMQFRLKLTKISDIEKTENSDTEMMEDSDTEMTENSDTTEKTKPDSSSSSESESDFEDCDVGDDCDEESFEDQNKKPNHRPPVIWKEHYLSHLAEGSIHI